MNQDTDSSPFAIEHCPLCGRRWNHLRLAYLQTDFGEVLCQWEVNTIRSLIKETLTRVAPQASLEAMTGYADEQFADVLIHAAGITQRIIHAALLQRTATHFPPSMGGGRGERDELRNLSEKLVQQIVRDVKELFQTPSAGRPTDEIPVDALRFCDEIYPQIIKAKSLLRGRLSADEIAARQGFEWLRKFPEILKELADTEPLKLARKYTVLHFNLSNGTDSTLEKRFRQSRKNQE